MLPPGPVRVASGAGFGVTRRSPCRGTGLRACDAVAPSARAAARGPPRCRERGRTGGRPSARSAPRDRPCGPAVRPRSGRRQAVASVLDIGGEHAVRSMNDSGVGPEQAAGLIATRNVQTRSVSPSRCDATSTAIPNCKPVRLTRSGISCGRRGSGRSSARREATGSGRGPARRLHALLHAGRITP